MAAGADVSWSGDHMSQMQCGTFAGLLDQRRWGSGLALWRTGMFGASSERPVCIQQ